MAIFPTSESDPVLRTRRARLIERLHDAWELIQSGDADTEAIAQFLSTYEHLICEGANFLPEFRRMAKHIRDVMRNRDTDDFLGDSDDAI